LKGSRTPATLKAMITSGEIEKLAQLSRITLTPAEVQSLVTEFDSILGYIDQLKKVDVSLETEGRVGSVKNVMRIDEAVDVSAEDRERLLVEVPRREGDFVAVKKIIAQD
jgi:aspartyl/glutamyl-tRNA(Asn/Gln) amidotransferase C subunit